MLEYFLSFLILTGAIFTFIGSLGLVRLKDLYTRLHGPTKATTLGVGSLLIASTLYFSTHTEGVSLHEILITLFLFITAPVSAHLLAKAALHLSLPSLARMAEQDAIENDASNKTETTEVEEAEEVNETAKATTPAGPEQATETHHKPNLKK